MPEKCDICGEDILGLKNTCHCLSEGALASSPCSPDVVSWDQWKQTLDERDEARREIERVKRLVRMLDDSPKSLLNHLVSWANGPCPATEQGEVGSD